MDLFFILVGCFVGFIIGLTGVGGGSLMTPILVLVFSVQPMIAIGTDLLYAGITKFGGIFIHQKKRNIDWNIVFLLAIGSLPTAIISIVILRYLQHAGAMYEGLILQILGIALILTAIVLMVGDRLSSIDQTGVLYNIRCFCQHYRKQMTIVSGIIIGFLVTFSSVGAGAIGAAVLFFLYPEKRTIAIVGTDLAHAVPLTVIAGIGYVHLGTVDFLMLATLLVGSLPGVYLGGMLGSKLSDKIIRPLLAMMLFGIGIKLFFFK